MLTMAVNEQDTREKMMSILECQKQCPPAMSHEKGCPLFPLTLLHAATIQEGSLKILMFPKLVLPDLVLLSN